MKSLWKETEENIVSNKKELNEDLSADVCVIGGGITGISTSYYLSKAGMKVTLLERDSLADKTTGNSTAKITSQHGLFYKYLLDDFGKDFAKKYYLANQEAINRIAEIVKSENIDCDFEWQDAYVFTADSKELSKIKDEVEAVKSFGGEADFVEKIEPSLSNVKGAIKFPNQAKFNPRKYVKGLVKQIENCGSEIYENSKVISVENKNDEYIVSTDKASVKAKYVVVATNYPIINAPGFYFIKMYQEMSYGIAAEVDHNLFEGMYINVENPRISLRTAKYNDKNFLIVVGMDHRVGAKIDLENAYDELENVAKSLYKDAKVLYRWNTEDCITLDKIPYIGDFSKIMKNIYVATGYKEWGMTTSNVAAKIISDKILGKSNEYKEIFTSTRIHPIKNRWEFKEMIKETTNSLIINKFKIPEDKLKDIGLDEGGIIELDGNKVGVYKDMAGNIFSVKPICTHLGCELSWNNLDKTWDCPCHGSRFDYMGKWLYDPAIEDLEVLE